MDPSVNCDDFIPVKRKVRRSVNNRNCHTIKRTPINMNDLFNSARYNKAEQLRKYIKLGVDVNTKDRDGSTPLHLASYHGHPQIVKLLLESGADTQVRAHKWGNRTPIEEAEYKNNKEVIEVYNNHK